MENIHNAIAWYQKKIGSYDKQLWEQSVEKKLQKGLPNVHHAPRKTVRLKTEYIDVDLIRGSTFTKTKPQVPWIYITKKAFVRVLFFPFYYRWWVLQSSRKVFYLLLSLYLLQTVTAFIYFSNLDGSIVEDELTLTEVVAPMCLMFLLGLIHAQTVLAHFSLKPPRRDARHCSKQKKKTRQSNGSVPRNHNSAQPQGQGQTTSDSAQHDTAGGGGGVQEHVSSSSRKHHHHHHHRSNKTTSLWNLPHIEIGEGGVLSSSPPPPPTHASTPNSPRKSLSQTRTSSRGVSKRAGAGVEKKNVRIAAADNNKVTTPKPSPTNSSSVVGVVVASSVDSGTRSSTSSPQADPSKAPLHSTPAAAPPHSSTRPHKVHAPHQSRREKEEAETAVTQVTPPSGGSGKKGRGKDKGRKAVCGGKDNDKGRRALMKEDRSSSGVEEERGSCECAGGGAGGSGAGGSGGVTLCEFNHHHHQPSSRQQDTATTTDSDSILGMYEVVHSHTLNTTTTTTPSNLSQPKTLDLDSSAALDSLTEGEGTDRPRGGEEDNLSDTGHVSNSSNYNPSDSGSEAEEEENCRDDGDSVGMPVPKSALAASAAGGGGGGVGVAQNSAVLVDVVGGGGRSSSSSSPSPSPPASVLLSSSATCLTANTSPRKLAQQQQQQLEGESSASDPGSPDARQLVSGLRRRRRASANANSQGSGSSAVPTEPTEGATRPRPLPPKLLSVRAQSKVTQTSGVSSSENEAHTLSAEAVNKATISSEEWEDRMGSDVTTSSSYSTSNSESELSENESNIHMDFAAEDDGYPHDGLHSSEFHDINLLQPPTSTNLASHNAQPDKVSCVIWEGNECKKLDLTALDIGWAIIDKVDNLPESSDYIFIGVAFSLCLGCVPLVYRFYYAKDFPGELTSSVLSWLWTVYGRNSWGQSLIMINGFIQRLFLSCIYFFLLTVTDRTFKQRLLYAKHFSYLTSSRRARKFDMPHFRLNKVRNIKIWLSLRSYLKRRGPQRSVDVIVSASFYLAISVVCLMCIQMLKDAESYLDFLCNWELMVWCVALGIYMMRFMTLGLKINKKYRNLSVLITEQINLYLQMEQKPHKKEELTLANNVLRLAEDLLKELESPFKISGFSANPLVYNIIKVVVLSAFSAVLTEALGFKLKLYKIKLK